MKLSELIAYRNLLNSMSAGPIQHTADIEFNKILHTVGRQPITLGSSLQDLANAHATISDSFRTFETHLDQLKHQLTELIDDVEHPWFAESYRLYEQEMIHETAEYTLNRRPPITTETEEFYKNRITRYTSWKHPAMILRPGLETYINAMVDCDPLYLVDEKYDLLTPAITQYNEVYQRRVRPYIINERQDGDILTALPNNQFGLIFAYNFFNYRPFEVIRQYLNEIYQKLRPGGVLAMTINDCDRDKGVQLVEQHFCCYTPGKMVVDLAQSLGFETVFTWTDDGPSTWIELRRPGELTSLRGGQTLAKIVPK